MADNQYTLEIGTSVPSRLTRTLYDDFLPQLRGTKALKVYREMSENDATVGTVLYAIEQLSRQVDWTVTGDDESTVDYVTGELDQMETGWDDFLAAVLSEIVYGWSMFELVYRRTPSGFGWGKFGFRPQASWAEWVVDENGQFVGFRQDTGKGTTVPIAAEKLIHFRTSTGTGKLEGVSFLRRAYRPWYFKSRIEDYLGVGIERELNGLPHAEIPLEVIEEKGEEWDEWKKLVNRVRVDEQGGIITPLEYDENGKELYRLNILSGGGTPKIDSRQVWRDFSTDIAGVMLAQFVNLGRDTVGSRALAEPQQDIFLTALEALLDSIEEQFHRQATMRLAELNSWTDVPRVKHGDVSNVNLGVLGQFILQTAQAGYDWFIDEETGNHVRSVAGIDVTDTVES